MKLSDMRLWVSTQLGEKLSDNTSADPRFFSFQEFILWMNLYRKEFNEDAKLLVKSSTVTTVANQGTYAWTAFSPAIAQPVDYLRFTYSSTSGGNTVIKPMDFVDKEFLDTVLTNWDKRTTGTPAGSYIYLNTHNVFGVKEVPGNSTDSIAVDWVYPPADYSQGDNPDKTSEFPDDLMDRVPLFAVLSTAFLKRGDMPKAQALMGEYQAQKAKKIGHIRYDQTAKPRYFRSYTDKARKSYRSLY